jgi:hypothetical protein
MPMLVFFEHICCPASKQAKRTESPGASNAAGNT